jgi:subtilisin family serine protease
MLPRFRIESLEHRVLLASTIPITVMDGMPVATINWQGQQAQMFAGRWVVGLNGVSGTMKQQAERGADLISQTDAAFSVDRSLGGDGFLLVLAPQQMQPTEVVQRLSRVPGFRSINPDFRYTLDVFPNDPNFPSEWGLHNTGQLGGTSDVDIDAPEAWNTTSGSSNVAVGICDTGIDLNHPDLISNIWSNPGEIPGNFTDDDLNGYVDDVNGFDFFFNTQSPQDDGDHGSHTAGTVGARGNNSTGITGVNWNVKLIACKIGSGASISGAAGVAAMYYLRNLKTRPTNSVNVVAVNHSWGGTFYDASMDFIIGQHAVSNIMTVCSAGNNNSNNDFTPRYPSSYDQPNVIAVANLTQFNTRSPDSNYGASSVDLAAPGTDVLSTIRVSSGSYAFFSGTSMAAPHVAGVVALCAAANPTATFQQIKDAILQSVDPVPAFNGITVTGGRLNANNALARIAVPGVPATPDLTAGSDTGQFSNDNITRDNTPTFLGTGIPGTTIKIYANGSQVGQGVVPPTTIYQITTSALADNVYNITATASNTIGESSPSSPLQVTIDTTAPQVSSFVFNYLTSPHSLAVNFSENVGWSVADGDFLVENLDTPGVVPSTGSYDGGLNRYTLGFPGNPVLPDADYRITVSGAGVLDVAGNNLTALVDPTHDFFFMMGDANHDRTVNLIDFNIVAANFGQSPRDFSQGDFTYDSLVNLSDFNVLAARFGNVLAGPAGGSVFNQTPIGARSSISAADPLDDLLA